jgi:hypothetical protein
MKGAKNETTKNEDGNPIDLKGSFSTPGFYFTLGSSGILVFRG